MTFLLAQVQSLFTAPVIAGAAAAAVSIPILIHLLWRVRRQRQVWAAMRFLQVAIKKQKNKLRLEHLLLLLARCLMLLLLGLGLAGPVGAGLSRLFTQHAGQKLVYMVLDDTLTSQAQPRAGINHTRLDDLKEQAQKLVGQMGEKDQLAIWRSSVKAMPLQGPTLLDKSRAMQLIDSIKARHTASDLPSVLAQVQAQLDDAAYSGYEQTVVILSDFSHGSLGTQVSQSFDRLARQATVCLSEPAVHLPDVCIANIQPRRSQILRPLDGPVALMLDVTLVREGRIDQPATTTVRLLLEGQSAATREHHWVAGQSQATVQMDMTWPPQSATFPLILPIEAKISTDGDLDRLSADDRRWAQVRLREQLRILLVDESLNTDETGQGFSPSDWLAFALSPNANNLNVQRMLPAQLNTDALGKVDVCMVLRPDRLNQRQMAALDQWTRAGGLLWVFTPAESSLPIWAYNLAQQMQIPMRLNVKTLTGDWGLAQADRPPSALSLLGADWQALLRPVRVAQALDLFTPQSLADHGEVWLRLDDEAQTPLLVSQEVGDGQVLLSALALNPDWSNLQMRPLFVPLLHESIASLTSRSQRRQLLSVMPGTVPRLGSRFVSSTQFIGPKRVMLKADQTGSMITTVPLDEPGVYRAQKDGGNNLLLVNIDPAAASLAVNDEHAVRQILFEQTPDSALHWLDRDNPTWPTADQTASSQLGRNLLWLAMALLIIETLLARWFSHAGTEQRSWAGWVGHGIVKLLHLDHLKHHPRHGSNRGKGVGS